MVAVAFASVASLPIGAQPTRTAPAENLLPLGPPTPGGRNAGCQVLSAADARKAIGRSTVIGQYDSGNLIICNLGLGNRMIQIGVFNRGSQSTLWWNHNKTVLRQNRAAGMTVTPLRGVGDVAWKMEREQPTTFREVTVRVGQRAFRVTVMADSATMPQLVRIAQYVAARLR